MDDNKKIEKTAKLIFNAGTARSLLRAGCEMIDIKQSRENADKTIFVFKRDEIFEQAFAELNDSLKRQASDEPAEACHE